MSDTPDDLEATIRSAFDQAESPTSSSPPGEATPAVEPAAQSSPADAKVPAGERQRDETGKFVKPEAKEQPAKPAETKPADTSNAQAPLAAQAAPAVAAPVNWKGAAKVEWQRLPQNVQKEIADDYSRLSQTDGELTRLKSAIGDRAPLLAATYGSVEQGIQNLFQMSDFATKNAPGFILWFAQQRGINLAEMVQGASQGHQPASDPHPLEAKVSQLEGALRQFLSTQQQGTQSQLQSQIDAFASDAAHPYFNDVKPTMAAFLQSGEAKTLQDAYDKAVWTRPEIREQLLDAQAEEMRKAEANRVAAAKNAAGSITGSPTGAIVPRDEPSMDLDAVVRKAFEAAGAA